MSSNIKIEYENETFTISQLKDRLNSSIELNTIRERKKRGVKTEELFKSKCFSKKIITIDGVSKTAKEWSKQINITLDCFKKRYDSGKRDKDLLLDKEEKAKKENINGEFLTLKEISSKYNIKIGTLKYRKYKMKLKGNDLI